MTQLNQSLPKKAKNKSHPFWRFFWLSFLVVSLAYAWYCFYAPSNEIKWAKDITSPEELKSNSNKKTMLFFTGQWCSPCRIMKREVLSDEEVEQILNREFTSVMIDIAEPKTTKLVEHFKVKYTPTTIILDAQGEIIEYVLGKVDKDEFIGLLGNS